jgi:chromosome segregation ATPase
VTAAAGSDSRGGSASERDALERRYRDAVDRLMELETEMAERLRQHAAEVAEQQADVAAHRRQLDVQARELEAASAENAVLRDTVQTLEGEIRRLTEVMTELDAELRTVLNSRSWRATRLVRELRWLVFPPDGSGATVHPTRGSRPTDPPRSST